MKLFFIKLLVLGLLLPKIGLALDLLSMDKKSKLFKAYDKTVPIVTAKHISWAENWKWMGINIKPEKLGVKNSKDRFIGKIPKLDVDFSLATKQGTNQLTWTYDITKKMAHPNAIGFGIEFKLYIKSPSFETPANPPELLPDNQGWRWSPVNGQGLEVRFTPGIAKVFFEQNQKNTIRALFFTGVNEGNQKVEMTVTTLGNAKKVMQVSASEEESEPEKWDKDVLSELSSPVDLSFLNAKDLPAGKHGFVKAEGDKLVFSDGTPVKFWGSNMMAHALFFTSESDIKAHAKRIAQLGFNLIRIHHHDSSWVKPNIFLKQKENTLELSPKAFRKLDWWIKCLKEEGVYVWLDLHVGRVLTSNDGIEYFDEIAKNDKDGLKGFNYYNQSIQKRMQEFNSAYLNHVNEFTNLAYKNDPAVIALLITNENDITQHFGYKFLPKAGLKEHMNLFNQDLHRFISRTGLNEKKAAQVWDIGDAKIYLSDVEHRFNQAMITHLKKEIGVKSMIATTNSWGKMGLSSLPSLTDGDLIDTHSYAKMDELSYNPRFNPGYLTWIGGSQVTGKPLSVTEWNLGGYPVLDRQTVPLFTASIASLQGWDAMMLYGYSQDQIGKAKRGSNWTGFSDPSMMGLMPAAALLYREGHISPSRQTYELKLDEKEFFYKKQDPTTSKTIRTLLETSRFSVTIPEIKALPWLKENLRPNPDKAIVINDPNKDFIPAGQEYVQSDTGEIKRDWTKGIHTINTSRSQVVSGAVDKETIQLDDVTFKIATNKAVAAVQSLDNAALKNSKNIFITLMARSLTGPDNTLPFSSEPVAGTIIINAPSGLKLYPISKTGERLQPLATNFSKGKYTLQFDGKNKFHWFLLTRS